MLWKDSNPLMFFQDRFSVLALRTSGHTSLLEAEQPSLALAWGDEG